MPLPPILPRIGVASTASGARMHVTSGPSTAAAQLLPQACDAIGAERVKLKPGTLKFACFGVLEVRPRAAAPNYVMGFKTPFRNVVVKTNWKTCFGEADTVQAKPFNETGVVADSWRRWKEYTRNIGQHFCRGAQAAHSLPLYA